MHRNKEIQNTVIDPCGVPQTDEENQYELSLSPTQTNLCVTRDTLRMTDVGSIYSPGACLQRFICPAFQLSFHKSFKD